MRIKDFFAALWYCGCCGVFFTVIGYFIWTDVYAETSNSIWLSIAGIGLLSSPLSYIAVMHQTKCPQCSKAFSISNTHQTDIENFVRYKKESVTENGHTRTKNVPYNVRRFHQHTKCDHCGHQSKYEAQEENKA